MVKPSENKVIKAIKEVRELFNEVRNNFSQEETKKREKLHKKEVVYKMLSEKDNLKKKRKKNYKKILKITLKYSKKIQKKYKNTTIILHMA